MATVDVTLKGVVIDGLPSGGGEPGPAGASAYEIAVQNGFVGTEQEWLQSLVGEDGEDGQDGVSPPAPAFAIGEVTTVPNGTGSAVALNPVGDGYEFDFQLEAGPQGEPGSGSGGGADGASAYEVAVANGFVGTEVEWLASLQGPKGDLGLPGTISFTGIAVQELDLAGSAESNSQDIQTALESGKVVICREGRVNVVNGIRIPSASRFYGAGVGRIFGDPIRATVFTPVSGQDLAVPLFTNFNPGGLMSGCDIGGFGVDGSAPGAGGGYNIFRFDGMGNCTRLSHVRIRGCNRGIVLNNAYNADNSVAWYASIENVWFELNKRAAIALVRGEVENGDGGASCHITIRGVDHSHPLTGTDAEGLYAGFPLQIHRLGEYENCVNFTGFTCVVPDAAQAAVKVTSTPRANLVMTGGHFRQGASQAVIQTDRADFRFTVFGMEYLTNPLADVAPEWLVEVVDNPAASIRPYDGPVASSYANALMNGRKIAWA